MCRKNREYKRIRKIAKREFKFMRQRLTKLVIQKNMALYYLLMEKKTVLGSAGDEIVRRKLNEMFVSSLDNVDAQVRDSIDNEVALEELHHFQSMRREFLEEFFNEYVDNIEYSEEQDFVDKNCSAIDCVCFGEKFKYKVFENVKSEVDNILKELRESESSGTSGAEETEDTPTTSVSGNNEGSSSTEEIPDTANAEDVNADSASGGNDVSSSDVNVEGFLGG